MHGVAIEKGPSNPKNGPMSLRIVVAEDNPRYRATLQILFRGEPEFELADAVAAAIRAGVV